MLLLHVLEGSGRRSGYRRWLLGLVKVVPTPVVMVKVVGAIVQSREMRVMLEVVAAAIVLRVSTMMPIALCIRVSLT